MGIDRNFDRRSILGCIPPFGWGAFYVFGVQMGCIYFPYHHFVACFITLSHFFAALLRERLLGPKTMKGVYKSASITFLLKVFFRLLAMVSTSFNQKDSLPRSYSLHHQFGQLHFQDRDPLSGCAQTCGIWSVPHSSHHNTHLGYQPFLCSLQASHRGRERLVSSIPL